MHLSGHSEQATTSKRTRAGGDTQDTCGLAVWHFNLGDENNSCALSIFKLGEGVTQNSLTFLSGLICCPHSSIIQLRLNSYTRINQGCILSQNAFMTSSRGGQCHVGIKATCCSQELVTYPFGQQCYPHFFASWAWISRCRRDLTGCSACRWRLAICGLLQTYGESPQRQR